MIAASGPQLSPGMLARRFQAFRDSVEFMIADNHHMAEHIELLRKQEKAHSRNRD